MARVGTMVDTNISVNEARNIIASKNSSFINPHIMAASVYESSDEDEGTIRVTLPDADRSGTLVLSSYSPVNWIIENHDEAGIYGVIVYSHRGASSVTADTNRLQTYFVDREYIESEDQNDMARTLGVMSDEIDAYVSTYSTDELELDSIADSTDDEDTVATRDFWDLDDTFVYGVGVYEGVYPDGDSHSFGYHPQGEITLKMNKRDGQSEDTMLVLTAYEPVQWKLTGDATEYVTRVFLSGYYDQEIIGISPDVEVVHLSHESGDSEYFYPYENNSKNLTELEEYIEDKSGDRAQWYWRGAYSLDAIGLGQKG